METDTAANGVTSGNNPKGYHYPNGNFKVDTKSQALTPHFGVRDCLFIIHNAKYEKKVLLHLPNDGCFMRHNNGTGQLQHLEN